jgi:glutathione S-transferase
MAARLVTIPFSHYCEKARWALEACGVEYREEGHLPMFHFMPVKLAGGSRTVPLLVDGRTVVADSTPIVAWADAKRPGTLLPADERDREEALQLEDELDRQLGPATRRWAYFYLLPHESLDQFITRDVPRWQRLAFKVARPVALGMIRRGLKIDEAGVARSRKKIDEVFELVGELLADGRRFLVGDRFSVADLTFASLAAPVLFPEQYGVALPRMSDLPAEALDRVDGWRGSRAGGFALRIYANHRKRATA